MPDTQPHMAAGPPQLTDDDYAQLYAMVRSGDQTQRGQAAAVAKKLTPDEAQHYFDYQVRAHQTEQANPETHHAREDNSILGVPPELAVAGAVGVGRAVAGAGLSMAQRAVAGGRAILDQQVVPKLKYEATKSMLEHFGVPAALAIPAAIAISGYRKGGQAAATTAATEAETVAVDAARPAAASETPAPPAASAARTSPPRSTSGSVPAGRPPAIPLSATEQAAVAGLVKEGYPEEEVVKHVVAQRAPAAAPEPTPPPAAAAAKPKMAAAEVKEYSRLRKAGKTEQEATQIILAQRALQQRLGLPSSAEVRQGVVSRNATGRWPE
jgi:hypothetical protein